MNQQTQRWLSAVVRMAGDRELEPSAVILGSRTLRSSHESGERADYNDAKRKRSTKAHPAVNTPGLMDSLYVTLADADDCGEVERLTGAVNAEPEGQVETGFADHDYTSESLVSAALAHGLKLEAVEMLEAERGPDPELVERCVATPPLGAILRQPQDQGYFARAICH